MSLRRGRPRSPLARKHGDSQLGGRTKIRPYEESCPKLSLFHGPRCAPFRRWRTVRRRLRWPFGWRRPPARSGCRGSRGRGCPRRGGTARPGRSAPCRRRWGSAKIRCCRRTPRLSAPAPWRPAGRRRRGANRPARRSRCPRWSARSRRWAWHPPGRPARCPARPRTAHALAVSCRPVMPSAPRPGFLARALSFRSPTRPSRRSDALSECALPADARCGWRRSPA